MLFPTSSLLPVVFTVAASLDAQQTPPPLFRSSVDLIAVDAIVVDPSGRPVAGLRPDEFVVTVDSKKRAVATADFVTRLAADNTREAKDGLPVQPLVSSNRTSRPATVPRTVMVVVDEDNIAAGRAQSVAEAVDRFLARLNPEDRVGLVTIPYGPAGVDPTTNRDAVRQALKTVVGHLVPASTRLNMLYSLGQSEAFAWLHDRQQWERVVARECGRRGAPPSCPSELEHYARDMVADVRQRTVNAVRAFKGLMDGLSRVEGPKTVLFVSQELPVPSYLAERQDFLSEARSVAASASRANATVYVLQLDVPLTDVEASLAPAALSADANMRADGLETMTSLTGGSRLLVSGRADPGLERISLETSGYYLLGVAAQASDRDGKPHDIGVSVTRKGVEIRARRVVLLPPPGGAASARTPEDLVRGLLTTGASATTIPIVVTTYSLPTGQPGAPKVNLLIVAEIDQRHDEPAELAVGYALVDGTGRNAGTSLELLRLQPVPGHPGKPLIYEGVAVVPAGTYTLKLAAADRTGQSGSVTHRATARVVEAKGVTFGEVVLLRESLGGTDNGRAAVGAAYGESLFACLQAHHANAATPLGARLEVASTADSPSLAVADMEVRQDGHRSVATGGVALTGLAPGSYFARITLSADGTTLAAVTRPFEHASVSMVPPKDAVPSGAARPQSEPAAVGQAPEAAAPSEPSAAPASVDDLLRRVGAYVVEYGQRMSVVISTERYIQWMQADDYARPVSQSTTSEFALFRVGSDWTGFRDVFEVDGKPIRDRQDRLARLLASARAGAVEQARKIDAENARFNLGALQRNFNVPTMVLHFLRPENQARFRFAKTAEESIGETMTWKIDFQEIRQPSLIRTSKGKDMPVSGSLWVNPATGEVLQTRMEIKSEATLAPGRELTHEPGGFGELARRPVPGEDQPTVRRVQTSASITVSYRYDTKLGLLVPVEMRESYIAPALSKFSGKETLAKIDCQARYTDYKRFETGGRLIDRH